MWVFLPSASISRYKWSRCLPPKPHFSYASIRKMNDLLLSSTKILDVPLEVQMVKVPPPPNLIFPMRP